MRTQQLNTNEKFNSKRSGNFSAANTPPKSRFLVLFSFTFAAVVAALIVAVGIGICQYYFSENSPNDSSLANETWCSDLDVVVHSKDHEDALISCEGARDAIVFLKSHGLDVSGTIVIELLTELPSVAGSSAAGCYLESEQRVLILVYSEFRKFETWFGVPIDRSLYRSAVSHEVAHMVAGFNFTIPKPSIQAKEYIAYVTQFLAMEPVLREKVLSHFPGESFEGDWQMSTTVYMLDCMGFGIRAYLHFIKLTDSDEYLHAILNGEALSFYSW
jgi:hypothetical protein